MYKTTRGYVLICYRPNQILNSYYFEKRKQVISSIGGDLFLENKYASLKKFFTRIGPKFESIKEQSEAYAALACSDQEKISFVNEFIETFLIHPNYGAVRLLLLNNNLDIDAKLFYSLMVQRNYHVAYKPYRELVIKTPNLAIRRLVSMHHYATDMSEDFNNFIKDYNNYTKALNDHSILV